MSSGDYPADATIKQRQEICAQRRAEKLRREGTVAVVYQNGGTLFLTPRETSNRKFQSEGVHHLQFFVAPPPRPQPTDNTENSCCLVM